MWDKQSVKGIEKYIDLSKLGIETVPDFDEDCVNKYLIVNDEEELEWRSITDDPTIENSNVSIEELKDAMQSIINSPTIEGTFAAGSNEVPTTFWVNQIRPVDGATLHDVLFEQDSGWILKDVSTSDYRLMLSGKQKLTLKNFTNSVSKYTSFSIDTWIYPYSTQKSTLMDGIYIYNDNENISITYDNVNIRTREVLSTHSLTHISISIDTYYKQYIIYINGKKVDSLNEIGTSSIQLPETLTMFDGFDGEIVSFKIYNTFLKHDHVLINYKQSHIGTEHYRYKLAGLYEAKYADGANVNFYEIRSTVTRTASEINMRIDDTNGKLTEYKQDLDSFKFKVSVSGVNNLLSNSNFKHPSNNTIGWYIGKYNGMTGSVSCVCNTTWSFPDRSVNTVQLQCSNQENGEYGIRTTVNDLIIGKKYTLGFFSASHRIDRATLVIRGTQDSTGSWNSSIPIESSYGGQDIKNWSYVVHTFTASRTSHNIEFNINKASDDGYMWIAKPMLVEGDDDVPWGLKNGEIYEGITTIDGGGVTVSMKDGEGLQGYSTLNYEGLSIYNSRGQRRAWFGDNDSAFIDTLRANNIYNRHLVRWGENRPDNLYVASNATGDGTGRNADNKSNSINNALRWVVENHGRYSLAKNLNIYIDNGTYYEDIYIGGFLGSGVIQLFFDNNAVFYGNHRIEENTMYVYFNGRRWNDSQWMNEGCIFKKRNSEEALIHVRNSNCHIFNVRALKEGWSGDTNTWNGYGNTFIYATSGASVFCFNNDVVGFYYFVRANDNSEISIYKNRGHNYVLAKMNYGGVIKCQDYVPLHHTGAIQGEACDWVDKGNTACNSVFQPKPDAPPEPPPDPPDPPPPPDKVWKWFEQSFSLSNLRTAPEGSGSGTSSRSGEWGQGRWSPYQSHRGYADLGNSPSNWCSGGRNFSVQITMTRSNTSHGNNSNSPQPKLKQPDGSFWNSGIGFNRGQTNTFSLPSTIVSAIANGSMKTLEMWAGGDGSQYSFYNYSIIKIKCEKQV